MPCAWGWVPSGYQLKQRRICSCKRPCTAGVMPIIVSGPTHVAAHVMKVYRANACHYVGLAQEASRAPQAAAGSLTHNYLTWGAASRADRVLGPCGWSHTNAICMGSVEGVMGIECGHPVWVLGGPGCPRIIHSSSALFRYLYTNRSFLASKGQGVPSTRPTSVNYCACNHHTKRNRPK